MATKMMRPLTAAERKEAMEFAATVRQKINLTLNPDTIILARKFGDGNVSRGVDRCVLAYHQKKRARMSA